MARRRATWRPGARALAGICLIAAGPVAAQEGTSGRGPNTVSVAPAWSIEPAISAGDWAWNAGATRGGDPYISFDLGSELPWEEFPPSLTLDYKGGRTAQSDLPSDGLGYGWEIQFASSVRWCPAYSNSLSPRFERTENLCMGAGPLVLVSGNHLQPGARYRDLQDQFRLLTVRGGPALDEIWFEARTYRGDVLEIGRTADSRLLLRPARGDHGRQAPAADDEAFPRIWSVNEVRYGLDGAVRYEYFEDESAGMRVPVRIAYGVDQSKEIRFRYVEREDVATVSLGGYDQTQWLRLHTIEVRDAGVKTLEVRFESETARRGKERLRRVQLCRFPGPRHEAQCLQPIVFEWQNFASGTPLATTLVKSVLGPSGMMTEFRFGVLSERRRHDFAFGAKESPFGEPPPTDDAWPLTPTRRGNTKVVVTEVGRNGGGDSRRTGYGYLRPGWDSGTHWGFLGFPAARMTDMESGVVTYIQYRMDFPHLVEESAKAIYDRRYGTDAKPLAKSFLLRDALVFDHGGVHTYLPYIRQITDIQYANGFETAVRQITDTYTASVTEGPTGIRRTQELAMAASVTETGDRWGEVRHVLEHVVDHQSASFDLRELTVAQPPMSRPGPRP